MRAKNHMTLAEARKESKRGQVLRLKRQMRGAGLPEPVEEHRFDLVRYWRFDLAYPDLKVAVEYEGGVWSNGRHVRPRGYSADCEKYAVAAIAGWVVIRVTSDMLASGKGRALVVRAYEERSRGLSTRVDWDVGLNFEGETRRDGERGERR